MIYINRNKVTEPQIFNLFKERIQIDEDGFAKNHEVAIVQQLAKSQSLVNELLTDKKLSNELDLALKILFHYKCAFCESRIRGLNYRGIFTSDKYSAQELERFDLIQEDKSDPIMGAVNYACEESIHYMQFRPETRAMDLSGRESLEHYWWLAYEWKNIYLTCKTCEAQKGKRFPVIGKRISKGESTEIEKALLIDPCHKKDFEEEDIAFDGAEAVPLTESGKTTIDILGLNRSELIESRTKVLQQARKKVRQFLKGKSHFYKSGKLFSPGQPYLGAIISNARYNLSASDFNKLMDVMPLESGMVKRKAKLISNKKVHDEGYLNSKRKAHASTRSYSLDSFVQQAQPKSRSLSIEPNTVDNVELETTDHSAYFRSSKWISKIEIENFKNIKNIVLPFPRNISQDNEENKTQHPWLVLLGENGVGKSSVLQAVAMTLMGQKRLEEFKFDATEYVSRGGPNQTKVKIFLTDRMDPIELTINKDTNTFVLNEPEPQVILMAYGATRLLTKDKTKGFAKDFIRTKNLFDPFKQLDNVQDWLRRPDNVDDTLFEAIGESLSDLLMLKSDDSKKRFTRESLEGKWQILFEKEKGKKVPLDFLSSGYKAVIALALDIMVGLSQIYGQGDRRSNFQEAEGIALIDEIGVHLHPQWKMWIVGALRRTFPKMNFLVTTHEPLCLRGLEKGEVFVVNHDEENGIRIKTDLPSPKDLRIDQLLTSSYFGLNSVLDPIVEQKFNRYYELQSMGNELTEKQKKEFEILEPQILEKNVMLGSTLKEEMEYQVIKEKFEHFNKEDSNMKPETVKKEIMKELKDDWNDALFG